MSDTTFRRQVLEADIRRMEASSPRHPAMLQLRNENLAKARAELAALPAAPTAEEAEAAAEWQRYAKAQRDAQNAERRLEYSCRSR